MHFKIYYLASFRIPMHLLQGVTQCNNNISAVAVAIAPVAATAVATAVNPYYNMLVIQIITNERNNHISNIIYIKFCARQMFQEFVIMQLNIGLPFCFRTRVWCLACMSEAAYKRHVIVHDIHTMTAVNDHLLIKRFAEIWFGKKERRPGITSYIVESVWPSLVPSEIICVTAWLVIYSSQYPNNDEAH